MWVAAVKKASQKKKQTKLQQLSGSIGNGARTHPKTRSKVF